MNNDIRRTLSSRLNLALASTLVATLVGCGGGGGGAGAASSPGLGEMEPTPNVPIQNRNVLSVDCIDCGATNPTTFTPGVNSAVWKFENTTAAAQTVPVNLRGLQNNAVVMTLTNPTRSDITLPQSGNYGSGPTPMARLAAAPATDSHHGHVDGEIAEFNNGGFKTYLNTPVPVEKITLGVQRPLLATTGDTRRWTDCYGVSFATCNNASNGKDTTLVARASSVDGRFVNMWVQNTERGVGKVTDQMVTEALLTYAAAGGIHESLRYLGGEPWGSTAYPSQLIAAPQDINIVIANLMPDGNRNGLQGYYFSGNSFRNTVLPYSNEALVLFMDSEAMYLAPDLNTFKLTLAHEGTHLTNFYRRTASTTSNNQFDLWLEETTAMAAEDIVSATITPGYSPVRDQSMVDYLQYRSGNCSLTTFQTVFGTCFSYDVNAIFAGYLVRQLGVDFYRNLLSFDSADSYTALNGAIMQSRPRSSLARELQAWSQVTWAATPDSDLPAGAGYPAVGGAMPMVGIDLAAYQGITRFTQSAPAVLRALASQSWVRVGNTTSYVENIVVPPGAVLTITINNITTPQRQ
jgi:hypothetical protein